MKQQILLDDAHRALIRKCMAIAGYPAALARECRSSRNTFDSWDARGKRLSWATWIEIVSYARRSKIVGPFYDPITLLDPPAQDISGEAHEAAWMLDRLPGEVRARFLTDIAAAYGRAVARRGDEGEGRAGGVA